MLVAPHLHPDRDPSGFLPFPDIASSLTTLPADWRAARSIGTIKARHSRAQQRRYTSNGCAACDALIGEFFLHEALVEHVSGGRTLAELAVGVTRLPAAAVPDDEASVSLGCAPPRPGEASSSSTTRSDRPRRSARVRRRVEVLLARAVRRHRDL